MEIKNLISHFNMEKYNIIRSLDHTCLTYLRPTVVKNIIEFGERMNTEFVLSPT